MPYVESDLCSSATYAMLQAFKSILNKFCNLFLMQRWRGKNDANALFRKFYFCEYIYSSCLFLLHCTQEDAHMPKARRVHTVSTLVGQLPVGSRKRACAKHPELWPREKSIPHSACSPDWKHFQTSMQSYCGGAVGVLECWCWLSGQTSEHTQSESRLLSIGPALKSFHELVTAAAAPVLYVVQRGIVQGVDKEVVLSTHRERSSVCEIWWYILFFLSAAIKSLTHGLVHFKYPLTDPNLSCNAQ